MADKLDGDASTSEMIQREARFEERTFVHDLCEIGNAFAYAHALNEIKENGNIAPARALYYEGRLSDGFPFFEKYRSIENDAEYADAVNSDFEDHIENLIGLFPDFRMRLKMDHDTEKIMYVQSVFDICWYTLSRMVADVAPPMDEDLRYIYSQGKILSCLCCGKFFIRHSSRQLYCDNPNCQAKRDRRNRRASYARKKAAEAKKNPRK